MFTGILQYSLLFTCLLPFSTPVGADETRPAPASIPRLAAQITLDGNVTDAEWNSAWSLELAYEVRPGENTPAPVRTVVFLTHDNEFLYAGFRCYDPDPAAIRAHLGDHDNIGNDDWCGIILDTFNDERRDFCILVNPLGVQYDQIETLAGEVQWDGIWDAEARITDFGWSAELKIPFNTLRFQRSSSGQTWGFDAVRGWPRDTFHQMGAFARIRGNNSYQSQLLKIQGFEGLEPGRNVELIPTVTAVNTDVRSEPGEDFVNRDREGEAGITGRWGITPNLTLTTAINPDFSQVEADAYQLDINQPFALPFSERRPFFMEGSDFFATDMTAIYTRTIRDPSWGLKLTGKEAGYTIGGYVAEDDLTNLVIPGLQRSRSISLEQKSTASVLRLKRDLGGNYTVGALMTDREGDDYFSRLGGFDTDFRFTSNHRLRTQVLFSTTKYPGTVRYALDLTDEAITGHAIFAHYSYSTRDLNLSARY